jgi:putative nucleotidyltransferase with HDIG domain
MWPFKAKLRSRRMELRRGIAAIRPSLWRRLWLSGGVGAILLALLFYTGVAVMDLWPADPLPYRPRQFVPADIRARVPFRVQSESLLKEEQTHISSSLPATFVPNDIFIAEVIADLAGLPDRIKTATQPRELEELKFNPADAAALDEWRPFAISPKKAELDAELAKLKSALMQLVIVRESEAIAQRQRNTRYFKTAAAGLPAQHDISELISTSEVGRISDQAMKIADLLPAPLRPIARQRLLVMLSAGKPTYLYDNTATERDKEQALADLKSHPPETVFNKYAAGDVLVGGSKLQGPGPLEVRLLSENDMELLRAEHNCYLQEQGQYQWWKWLARSGGRATILLLITTLLCLYIYYFHIQLVADHARLFMLVAAMLILLGINKILAGILMWNLQISILTCLMSAAILAIAFGRRFAWTCATVFTIFVVMQSRGSLSLFTLCLLAVTSMIFQLREIRSRSKLLIVALSTAALTLLAQWALGLSMDHPLLVMWKDSLWAAGSALLAGFLAQGLLPLIEHIFGIATSMTLLEYADASKPVLKRLALEAPGTYNHSLQLGAMCEAAAEAIGARGLLARVGAYYHDIGKINKPDYFIENQAGSASRHTKLSPAMSLLIIIGHIKDGIELAREYGLPKALHEFITSHHGTTLVQYFYQAATEKRKIDADRAPDEVEFRYPGPKPRSKEAAILMLADVSESSVRSMGETTPGRIENQVHTMITRRLMDGQLDDCELTLREVHQIETSLIKSLAAMYHLRIPYGTPAGQKPCAAELLAARKAEEKQQLD